jgi:type IV secretory pathway protease TraF
LFNLRKKYIYLFALAIIFFLVAWQNALYVKGDSMSPSIKAGQWLWQSNDVPQRGELAIITEPDSGIKVVKRCVAIQGDSVQIIGGTLYVNGQSNAPKINSIKDLSPEWPADDKKLQKVFAIDEDQVNLKKGWWKNYSDQTLLYLSRPNDNSGHALAASCRLKSVAASFAIGIERGNIKFRLVLNAGNSSWSLEKFTNPMQRYEVIVQGEIKGGGEQTHELLISLAYDRLVAKIDGADVAALKVSKDWQSRESSNNEQLFIALRDECEFQNVQIGCQINYNISGNFGVGKVFHLTGDEFFFLGDNSSVSRDSRHYGAVSRDQIIGVATKLWPRNIDDNGWPLE